MWIDGVRESVAALDRGLQFGDGLFETIACVRGEPRFLRRHLERLTRGCARLHIPMQDPAPIGARVRQLARASERSIVKVVVTRGVALARGYAFSGAEKASCITFQYPAPQDLSAVADNGVKVQTLQLRLGENPALAGLKHCNRLEQILARAEWSDPAIFEGLLFSQSGHLTSGTMSNVFLVQAGRLATPRVDRCGVAGVMRAVVLDTARQLAVPVEECTLEAGALRQAEEIFLTNARIGILPVAMLDERALRIGPITQRLRTALAPLLEEPVDA
ncbi:MAG: aminodeoxychorismate lyase [Sinobacteraceae bacterium]|nr:aminodeoxychorismate lyase [Nevskiaceae bacterium]